MRSQQPATVLISVAMGLLILGWAANLFSQSPTPVTQDGINAMLLERMHAITARQDELETMVKYGLSAIMANLGAHLFQIWTLRRPRGKDD